MTAEQRVKKKWKSARILAGGNDVVPAGGNPRAVYFAVFVGAFNLKGGNGPRRRSAWKRTGAEAWADAERRLSAE